ncbi:serine/threonine-protein kinase EDR1-like [Phragmites australis]|uniref:serine/threonine-protein kinase EDR1-like n=1 Tax=Phragmites australis TaxID=29695 RepID=UPI002D7A359D|nr:serine/threonine-protein kinase EDR1-like [Phragmites australis]
MDETPTSSGLSEASSCEPSWWPPDFLEKVESVSISRKQEVRSLPWKASQLLWSTGTYSGLIPNGFYSIIPDKKLKEIFPTIPPLDDLQTLEADGLKADIIIVDTERDKKVFMLKQLSAALVKGLNSSPALVIKKIAGLVFDCFKRQNPDASLARGSTEDTHFFGNRGPQLLGQIRHGSCRPRAILFKVLADAVGLESKLVVGLPDDGAVGFVDSYKHMSVVVSLNSMELLVDLMRFPGQLIPFSAKAIFISHISAAGESDSAENDSCDSPLEPNSPLYGLSDKVEAEGIESSSNLSGRSLRNMMLKSRTFSEGKLSTSCSEPNIANAFWRRSQRSGVAEEPRGASSSPEHPLMRARGRSILGGEKQSFQEYTESGVASRSDGLSGSSTPNTRRIRGRSISITPEIGDDIVRAVRAMNETLKQNRLQRDHVEDSCSYVTEDQSNVNYCPTKDDASRRVLATNNGSRNRTGSTQKAMSLPTSPHEYRGQITQKSDDDFISKENLALAWNKVFQSSSFFNKPLLPFEEWNIDFSEITIGTRVGIGFFGEVFRGIWNGTDVAIKVFLEQDLTTENMEDFCNEIYILSRLRHPNVILFLGACITPPHLSMVTEYMEMGSLYYLIHMSGQKKKLSWRRRLKIVRDICRGLMCIHRMKIVHRDLKSANCLVNKHWTVKICDFGLSRVMTGSPMTDNFSAGTPEWMAPELIRNEPFTEKCDIFSLGVIMWELCTLSRPWDGISPVQVVYAVANQGSRLEIPEGPLGKLIADCWAEPDNRPSCQEILTRLLDCEYAVS